VLVLVCYWYLTILYFPKNTEALHGDNGAWNLNGIWWTA
jgi:hypothetical protein